jgi:hypothetical protein
VTRAGTTPGLGLLARAHGRYITSMQRPALAMMAAAGFVLAACGGPDGPAGGAGSAGDPHLYGAALEVRSAEPYVHRPELRERVRRVLAVTAEFYGRSTAEYEGIRFALVDGEVACRGRPGGYHGCADWRAMTATVRVDPPYTPFIETTTLPHEILHLFVGDPDHLGPEWTTLDRLYAILSAPYREEMREWYLQASGARVREASAPGG